MMTQYVVEVSPRQKPEWTVQFTWNVYRVVPRELNPVSEWSDFTIDLEQAEIVDVDGVPVEGFYFERYIRDQIGFEGWKELYDAAHQKLRENDYAAML